MRRSKFYTAVFTPAMPHMEAFLNRHIRPDHPLRHHPLWLSEDDLSRCQNLKVDVGEIKHTGKNEVNTHPPMLLANVSSSIFYFNMDQLLPESEIRWQLPFVTVPTSITTMKPYSPHIQNKLEHFRKVRGFESNWWGTRKRWLDKGAHVDPKAIVCVLPISFTSRFLHISMLLHAKEVLMHSFISGKTSMFFSWWKKDNILPLNLQFSRLVEAHLQKHNFQSPLYFSKFALVRAGIGIKPNADPLDITCFVRENSNGYSTETILIPDNVKTYQQYYHISQVILPDSYRIPLKVLEVERGSPGMPINGRTGNLLDLPELQYEAILNSPSMELASLIARDNDLGVMCSITDLESPNSVHGRNLWYLPHDVLELGGLIDVNAVPVEVTVSREKTINSMYLYNVEQLLHPIEGYKVVGHIACMGQFGENPKPHIIDDEVVGETSKTEDGEYV